MLETDPSPLRDGSPQLASATWVAEAFSFNGTPVATMLAAKDCIVVFCNDKY
jgi:hypothetical protein